MAMIEVTVKYIYGDYMIPWEEQEYHDDRVTNFKHYFTSIIENYGAQTIRPLIVDCEYYPGTQKFKIVKVTKDHDIRVARQLDLNPAFVKEFIK